MRYLAVLIVALPYIVLNYGAYRRASHGSRPRTIHVEGFPDRTSGYGVPHPGMRAIGILLPGLLIGYAVHRSRSREQGMWTNRGPRPKRKKRYGLQKKNRR